MWRNRLKISNITEHEWIHAYTFYVDVLLLIQQGYTKYLVNTFFFTVLSKKYPFLTARIALVKLS